MAEKRRAQLEQWRIERQRENRPVHSTTVAVQRHVVAAPPRANATNANKTIKSNTTKPRAPTAASKRGLATNKAKPAIPTPVVVPKSNEAVGSDRDSGRDTSLDSAADDANDREPPPSADKPRKEKRRTSFILPSPSNLPSLAGGAQRVLTPTRLTPPKADQQEEFNESNDSAQPNQRPRMEDSEESDGGLGPSPRKRRMTSHPLRVAAASVVSVGASTTEASAGDLEAAGDELAMMFDEGETDADVHSVRTTLSFGAISGPLRVLHSGMDSDDDDDDVEEDEEEQNPAPHANELGTSRVIDNVGAKPMPKPDANVGKVPTPTQESTAASVASHAMEPESVEPSAQAAARSAAPQRVAMRVLASGGGGSLGPPLRRTSTGEAAPSGGRKSLDEPKPSRSLVERLDEHRKWEMDDFVVSKSLGKGKFGNVYLAKEKHSNASVALKVLYKSPLILEGGLKNLQREIEIQHRLLHPNLLRLFGYFYDDSCVYLILEFAPHGELYKLLSKQRNFSEAFAAHYIAQVVDALEYLHGCHVIHRDIKPENLLMGPNHTIKLADFGWSVHAPQQFAKRRTFCGTPDYLSPEVLLNEAYDHRVDVWSVGVLAFEFLFGATPFHVDNQMEMYKRIENVDFHFPSEPPVSDAAKQFIRSLLQRNPDDRLTLAQARTHEWLAQRPSI